MSRGKIIILGSVSYITHHFSVGYHVIISLNKDNPKAADISREIIMANIPKCTEDRQTAKNTLKFILPLDQLPSFAKTFKALEEANIGQISVSKSNLEDAFVKIGEEEDDFS
jgi:hypothetical protein